MASRKPRTSDRVPANRGSLWLVHWPRPVPAEMALFFTGPDRYLRIARWPSIVVGGGSEELQKPNLACEHLSI
jgi:hypothetical protein